MKARLLFLLRLLAVTGCAVIQPTAPANVPPTIHGVFRAFNRICPKGCHDITFGETETVHYGQVEFLIGSRALILVDMKRLTEANTLCGSSFGPALYAHELGHVLALKFGEANEHTPHTWELAADRWAGCLLTLANIETKGWSCFFEKISVLETDTHPTGYKRNAAFLAGAAACKISTWSEE